MKTIRLIGALIVLTPLLFVSLQSESRAASGSLTPTPQMSVIPEWIATHTPTPLPSPTAFVDRNRSTPTPTDRTEAATAVQYVKQNSELLFTVQDGLSTWDLIKNGADFSADWVTMADGMLDLLGGCEQYFLAPPANTTSLGAFDQTMESKIHTLTTSLVPDLRAAVASRKRSNLDAIDARWKSFETDFAQLFPAIVKLPTFEPGSPVTHTLFGTLVLTDTYSNAFRSGSSCNGSGGYGDIAVGANVVVNNESGAIIGTGAVVGSVAKSSAECDLTFLAPGIPDASFYTVTIGHRSGPAYSISDLEANGWTIDLTIGN